MTCRSCKVQAFAKINLTLEVYGKRPDGYHALRSLVLPISLADTLEIELADRLATDTGFADDLILKAARILGGGRGASVKVAKRIPVGGGLGGGSADAAAALKGLNELWGLMAIGAQVGSDVPALIYGKPCIMEGRGEIVKPLPENLQAAFAEPLALVLANPGVNSSTREVYANCTPRLDFSAEKEYNTTPINDLEAPALRLYPQIGELKALMGAGAMMSGSGSTVFKIVASEAEAVAGRDALRGPCVFKKVRDEAEASRLAGELRARGYWAEIAHTIVR